MPEIDKLAELLQQAQTGAGSDWMPEQDVMPFCAAARAQGLGVCNMEAIQAPDGTIRRLPIYEILGVDGEDAWDIHRDPERSVDLVRRKLEVARRDGARFLYKLWVDTP